MASLWDTITGRNGKNASAEQLKKQEARDKAEAARRKAEDDAENERQKAIKDKSRVTDTNPAGIQFKKGGMVRGDGAAQRGKTRGKVC